ncbi:hypothetical protein [Reinekea thalattae]|uniref:Uncharacterized protein n=1 Tax=Reinekea thalattae TaxID=2593301 RepID=A0A5C8ZBJ0_9GAMM|nr:hypothetical protein [Reinekea thalattae]TXR54649.1 hypothetical protein FME95_08955 [Reinekea thalattae]
MKKLTLVLYSVGLAIIVVPVLLLVLLFRLTSGLCSNQVYAVAVSPDSQYKAVVFQRDCGATTGLNTQISVVRSHHSLKNSAGNIFIAPGSPEEYAINLYWSSDSELNVMHVLDGSEYKVKHAWGIGEKVQVHYTNPT